MKPRTLMLLLATGCGPSAGPVFVDVQGSSSSSSSPTTAALSCDDVGVLEGDDDRFAPSCGERCDTDWCACEPCTMAQGPLARLSQGPHRLRILGGASGTATFDLTLTLEDGVVVHQESRTCEGLFDDTFDFDVPQDCALVELSYALASAVCSRVYEYEIDPA